MNEPAEARSRRQRAHQEPVTALRTAPADSDAMFRRFKWEIFGDAAFEDVQGLWEPLWLLRGSLKQPEMAESERQDLAARALRELAQEGLIYFFGVPLSTNPADAADDASLRLRPDELDATLDDDWWRGTEALPVDHPDVWWTVTEHGAELARKPTDEMTASWFPRSSSAPGFGSGLLSESRSTQKRSFGTIG